MLYTSVNASQDPLHDDIEPFLEYGSVLTANYLAVTQLSPAYLNISINIIGLPVVGNTNFNGTFITGLCSAPMIPDYVTCYHFFLVF